MTKRKLLLTEHDVDWIPVTSEVSFYRDDWIPPQELITSVLVYAFSGIRILMVDHVKRGWDVPGGHLLPGEHPTEALQREVMEETSVHLKWYRSFGYYTIDLGEHDPDKCIYPYPKSYVLVYLATVGTMKSFAPNSEIQQRKFMEPAEALATYWLKRYRVVYDAIRKTLPATLDITLP